MPAAAQTAISRVLGRELRSYRAHGANGVLIVANDAQRLSAPFAAGGVEVRSGPTTRGFSLQALGYGHNLSRVGAAPPRARANRVYYLRGPLTEWYVDGPLGLEQGFTLRQAPGRRNGPLTLELAARDSS